MNIQGWAFKKDELELRDKNTKRFKEIEHLYANLGLNKKPCYGRCEFTGQLEGDEAMALSEFDIALLADRGNLCFGGSCSKGYNGSFSGTYNTD